MGRVKSLNLTRGALEDPCSVMLYGSELIKELCMCMTITQVYVKPVNLVMQGGARYPVKHGFLHHVKRIRVVCM